jgi:hypothetical protein
MNDARRAIIEAKLIQLSIFLGELEQATASPFFRSITDGTPQ